MLSTPTSSCSGNTQDQYVISSPNKEGWVPYSNFCFISSHSFLADCFSLLPLSSGAPPPLVTMTDGTASEASNARRAKRAHLPQFREARPRKTPAQQNTVTYVSSVLSVQRSSAGKLTTQEREWRHQTSSKEPSPCEEPLPAEELSPPLDLASTLSSVSTEVPQKLKRKRVNTTKVSSIHYIQV